MKEVASTAAKSFASKTGEYVAESSVNTTAARGLVGNITTDAVAMTQKNALMRLVREDASRPKAANFQVVSSVAYEGLRHDYMRLCRGDMGGLQIVYDGRGMGKSRALQGVARAKSSICEPSRFLVINILDSGLTCNELYELIQMNLGVANMGLSPNQVAEVVRYGLIGPVKADGTSDPLPRTSNKCRISMDSIVPSAKKNHDFPIFVLDEFNPIDFDDNDWPDGTDYTRAETKAKMGEVFQFFSSLAGLAYLSNGFVALIGTRSKAVARGLLKINEGTKAALSPCTKLPGRGQGFDAWRGFDWTKENKTRLLKMLYEKEFKEAVGKGTDDQNEIDRVWMNSVAFCMSEPDIRLMCMAMSEQVNAKEDESLVVVQNQTNDTYAQQNACCGGVDCAIL